MPRAARTEAFRFTDAQRRELRREALPRAVIDGIEADVTAYRLQPWADSIERLRGRAATPRTPARQLRESLDRIGTHAEALRRALAAAPREVADTLTLELRLRSDRGLDHPGLTAVDHTLALIADKAERVRSWIPYNPKSGRRGRRPAVLEAAVAERLLTAGLLHRLPAVLHIVLDAAHLATLPQGGALDRWLANATRAAHAAVARANHRRATS